MEGRASDVPVRLEGVTKAFGSEVVLDRLDLDVRAGETLVIIGRSGTGKSVTIRHIVGLERPDSGRVVVFGNDLALLGRPGRDALRLRIGYLFQSAALLNWLTVEENVELPLLEHRRHMKRAERHDLVLEKLEVVDMQDARGKYPGEISGGMKKRAALARAIVLEPEIILYDEPTAGLDPVIASTINDLIRETAETTGATQVVVTHDMESAYRVADRIAMLFGGRIIEEGGPAEIRASANPVVRQFISGNTKGPITDGISG
jgi:phospholipid/cholesterol/gamma-HCH transport system ATP-binding protein